MLFIINTFKNSYINMSFLNILNLCISSQSFLGNFVYVYVKTIQQTMFNQNIFRCSLQFWIMFPATKGFLDQKITAFSMQQNLSIYFCISISFLNRTSDGWLLTKIDKNQKKQSLDHTPSKTSHSSSSKVFLVTKAIYVQAIYVMSYHKVR